MSLYIGKNAASGNGIIVTENERSLSEMKASSLPVDTIYSSSQQFMVAKTFACDDFRFYSNSYGDTTSCRMPIEAVDEINARVTSTTVPLVLYAMNKKVLYSYGLIFNNRGFIWTFSNTGVFSPGTQVPHSTYPTSAYRYKFLLHTEVGLSSMADSIDVIVTNIDLPKNQVSGGISYNRDYLPYNGNKETLITKNSFIVEGVDLANVPMATKKSTGASNIFYDNSGSESFSILTPNTNNDSEFKANANGIYLKNGNNEFVFNTDLGYLHIKAIENNPTMTHLSTYNSGLNSTYYINNIVADGTASFFSGRTVYSTSYVRYNSPFGFSCFISHSSIFTTWYSVAVTAGGTTYAYSIAVQNISGVNRYVLKKEIIHMGVDGPGQPYDYPPIIGIVQLYE